MTTPQTMTRNASHTPVWTSGTGPTVILVHGVMMDHRMWARQVDALSVRYRVCCIDMLGHGLAPDRPGERSLDDFVNQVHEVVQQFSDPDPPVLAGFSMGGLIAQAYAVHHHTDLSGLILMNTVYDRTPEESAIVRERFARIESGGVESAIETATGRWFKERDHVTQAGAIKEILSWMCDGEFAAKCKARRVFAASDSEVTGKLGFISCPTLVMTGEDDAGSTPSMSRNMAASIPNAQLEILDGQNHMMSVLDAARVNAILLDFLSKCTETRE